MLLGAAGFAPQNPTQLALLAIVTCDVFRDGNAQDVTARVNAIVENVAWLASNRKFDGIEGESRDSKHKGEIEANHEAYVGEGEIAAANPVLALGKT